MVSVISMVGVVVTVCLVVDALQPLTEMAADPVELGVFATTLISAFEKVAGTSGSLEGQVVHVVGATKVEDSVDWAQLCKLGATLVLVGPQVEPLAKMVKGESVIPRKKTGQGCVLVIRGLYSRGIVREGLGDNHPAVDPDLVIVYNTDLYMNYWRRTLAELV